MTPRTKTVWVAGAAVAGLALVLVLTLSLVPDLLPVHLHPVIALSIALLAVFLLLAAAYIFSRHFFRRRIILLSRQVSTIGERGDPSARLPAKGRDEITRLTRSINSMLDLLQLSQQRQQEGENRFQAMANRAEEGFALIDPRTGRILDCNRAFQAILCVTPEQLVGLNLNNLIDLAPQLDELARDHTGGDRPFLWSGTFHRPDGEAVELEISAEVITHQGEPFLNTIIRDISERKRLKLTNVRLESEVQQELAQRRQVEAGLEKRERYLAALVDIQRGLLASRLDSIDYLPVLTTLGEATFASRVYLYQNQATDGESPEARLTAEWTAEGVPSRHGNPIQETISYQATTPDWLDPLARGEVIVGEARSFPEAERTYLVSQGIGSVLLFPLLVHGKFFGLVGFDSCGEARIWEASEIALLRIAASAISMTQERLQAENASHRTADELLRDISERKQVEQALRKGEESIRSLYNITSSQQLNFSEQLQALLVMGCQSFGLETGVLAHVNGDRYEVIEGWAPGGQTLRGTTSSLAETFSKETLQAGGPLAIAGVQGTVWESHPAYQLHQIEAYLGTPVVVGGTVFGTLNFSSRQPHAHPFTSTDKEFLRLMAQWVGGEVEREQSTQQVQKYAAEIIKKNQELAEARDQAVEASRLKSEFLTTISHEIRTPMNAVIGMSDLLLETNLTSDQREYAGVVRDSAQVLLTLLNDVLDLSKIESGKLDLEGIDFNPVEIVERSAELFIPRVREKGLAMITFVDPQIPQILKGDPTRLTQILFNLIGNAVKFTERGEIIAQVELAEQKPGRCKLHFSVTDTGIGLNEAARKRLFQPFTQADTSITRRYGGTGLGLAISKRLVELMEGQIGVDSQEGKGSTFWFTTWFNHSDLPANQAVIRSPQWVEQPRVILVDDSPSHNEILRRYLTAWGMRVDTAAAGHQAITMMQAASGQGDPFQMAFLDLSMPEMDGYALAASIQNDPTLAGTRLVLMTAFDERGQGEQALEFGFAAYLVKPVKQARLHEALIALFAQPAKVYGGVLLASDTGSTAGSAAVDGIDKANLAPILLAEDNLANQKLAEIQLQRLGYRVVTVSDGRQVLELLLQTSQKFSLLLLDCQMPEVDGFAVARILRKAELTSGTHLPIVAMTANASREDRETCLASGMDDYLSKPFKVSDLKAVLERWIKPEAFKAVAAEPEEPLQEVPVLDQEMIQGIRALQTEGEDFLGAIIDMYLQESSAHVGRLRSAVAEGQAKDIQKIAHTFKGSSGNLGAARLAEACLKLEAIGRDGPLDEAAAALRQVEWEYGLAVQALMKERKYPVNTEIGAEKA